jgi:hypothetical protein
LVATHKHESDELRVLARGLLRGRGDGEFVELKFGHAINLAQSELDLQRVQEALIRILEMMAVCPKSRASSSDSLEREKSCPEGTNDLLGALFPSAVSASMVEVIYADAFYRALSALQKLHRYERNAWLKRNRAIQQLMQVDGVP